jgi:Tfp pilus assembly protein PilX
MQRTGDYKVGKGKPPKEHQFQRGQSGNPKGKTAATKTLELQNAEAAMRIRERILRAAEAKLVECSTDDVLSQFVEAAMLKLLKDSEDRGLGAPVQPVDHTSNGKDILQSGTRKLSEFLNGSKPGGQTAGDAEG